MLTAIVISVKTLRRTRGHDSYKKLIIAMGVTYVFALLYATLLSRTVSPARSYRLEPMWSLRQALSVKGSVRSLLQGDLSVIKLNSPQALEAIVINLLLMVPLGYLMPMARDAYGKATAAWQAIISGSALSVSIEIVQLITCLGMLDVDDWVYNTVGAAMGYAIYKFAFPRSKSGKLDIGHDGAVRARLQ